MLEEFKKFIARGNVLDMAVGIIIGASFTTVVKSVVDDLLMPIIGIFTGGINFSQQFISLNGGGYETLAKAKEASAPIFAYGNFLNSVINFLIVAFVVFILVKIVNIAKDKFEKEQEAVTEAAPETPADILLLQEIRDLLKK